MKTIFRLQNVGLPLAVMIALGAVAGMAQNPCEDASGMSTTSDAVRADFAVKTIEGRKKFVETAKGFVEKYGACEAAKSWRLGEGMIPKLKRPSEDEADKKENDLVTRLNAALVSKNWMNCTRRVRCFSRLWDKYRPIEIASDSSASRRPRTPRVTKYTRNPSLCTAVHPGP